MALVQSAGIQGSANSSTIVVTFATAPASGDIVILAISQGSNGTGGATCPGFSAIPGISLLTLPTSGSYMSFLYKVAGASEPTTYTVTLNAGNWAAIQGWEFSGRNTSSPFTAVNSNTIASGAHPLSLPLNGVTAAAGDDVLWVSSMGIQEVSITFTAPTGFSNQLNTTGATSGFELSMSGSAKTNVSAGATGTLTGSATWSGISSDAAGAVISLASSGGGTAYTLTAAQGSYSLTGKAVTKQASVGAAEGAFTLTGFAATLTYQHGTAYNLAAATGLFSLSGETATRDFAVQAAKGSFSLSGFSTKAGYGNTAARGSFALTGMPASLIYSTNIPNAPSNRSRRFYGARGGR